MLRERRILRKRSVFAVCTGVAFVVMALKAMILAQQDQQKAQHETYTATLSSRATEIDRLKLLVDKL